MKEFKAYIKDIYEEAGPGECIGMLITVMGAPFAVIMLAVIFG